MSMLIRLSTINNQLSTLNFPQELLQKTFDRMK